MNYKNLILAAFFLAGCPEIPGTTDTKDTIPTDVTDADTDADTDSDTDADTDTDTETGGGSGG